MPHPLYMVDAFADKPFTGNPAGVCILDGPVDNPWMQNVAMEMNQAETAFVYPLQEGFSLRWFTPTAEVDLCGHATLATAHVLWETLLLPHEKQAVFETKSGRLTCTRNRDVIEMDFPAEPAHAVDVEERVIESIEAHPVWFGKNRMDYLIELLDEDDVRNLKVDMSALADLEARGFIFTAPCRSTGADFVSRFFAPSVGVPEDSATGSAHCCLGPYWAEKLERDTLMGYQASARGALIGVSVNGDRVTLRGKAVTTVKGELVARA